MITVKKGERERLITEKMLDKFLADGYEVVPEPEAPMGEYTDARAVSQSTFHWMHDGKRDRMVDGKQVTDFLKKGWKLKESKSEKAEPVRKGPKVQENSFAGAPLQGEGEEVPAVQEEVAAEPKAEEEVANKPSKGQGWRRKTE